MIITLSGRRVKRPLKNFVPARGLKDWKKGRGIWTRQAKALAPWAGVRYSLAVPADLEVPAEADALLHLSADIECLLQWWDAFPTAAQQDAYDRERAAACTECGGDGWVYAPVGHADERMGCPECAQIERSL